MRWTLQRYLSSSVYEFNTAALGYWRHYERTITWMTREIVWELITGNPNYKNEDKPKRKADLIKLSSDTETVKEKKIPKVTEQDIRVMEALNFKPRGNT